ncbi:galactosyltransferase-related protein [Spirosoma pollinicola]|uniref:galactosyltransferase-related protein n=1 Tax=Spirosoma pollinicola TaxID=2057025 RepID=UPI0012FD68F4
MVVGGVFSINKKYYDAVHGMNESFKRCEDFDFGLRFAQKGIFLTRLNETIVNHHTVSCMSYSRMKTMMLSGDFFYVGLLDRKHIANRCFLKILFRNSYSALFLLFCLLLIPFVRFNGIFPYIILLLVRSFFQVVSIKHHFGNFFSFF